MGEGVNVSNLQKICFSSTFFNVLLKKTRFDFIISLLFGFVKDIARYGFDIALVKRVCLKSHFFLTF